MHILKIGVTVLLFQYSERYNNHFQKILQLEFVRGLTFLLPEFLDNDSPCSH